MNAIVSRDRAKATWLTGLTGLLVLSAAFTMMTAAAPASVPDRSRPPAVTGPTHPRPPAVATQPMPARRP